MLDNGEPRRDVDVEGSLGFVAPVLQRTVPRDLNEHDPGNNFLRGLGVGQEHIATARMVRLLFLAGTNWKFLFDSLQPASTLLRTSSPSTFEFLAPE